MRKFGFICLVFAASTTAPGHAQEKDPELLCDKFPTLCTEGADVAQLHSFSSVLCEEYPNWCEDNGGVAVNFLTAQRDWGSLAENIPDHVTDLNALHRALDAGNDNGSVVYLLDPNRIVIDSLGQALVPQPQTIEMGTVNLLPPGSNQMPTRPCQKYPRLCDEAENMPAVMLDGGNLSQLQLDADVMIQPLDLLDRPQSYEVITVRPDQLLVGDGFFLAVPDTE